MPRPGGRKLEEYDHNKSDSADSDFDDNAKSSPRPARRGAGTKRKNPSSRSQRTPQKKRVRRGSDTSNIVDDDDEIEEDEFTAESEEEAPVERSAKTGRAVRAATKKVVGYEESTEDEEHFVEDTGDDESERDELNISPKKTRAGATRGSFKQSLLKPSKIVRLAFTNWEGLSSLSQAATGKDKQEDNQEQEDAKKEIMKPTARSVRSRTTSKPPQTAVAPPTRKSSRLSREPEPLQALSSSGRHAIPASSPDDDEDALPGRRAVGSKGPRAAAAAQPSRKMPSVVMEASQEGSQQKDEGGDEEAPVEPMLHDVVDSVEMQVEGGAEAEAGGAEIETILETDVPAAPEEAEAAVPAIQEPHQEDTDASEGPVTRRNLRVCIQSMLTLIRIGNEC